MKMTLNLADDEPDHGWGAFWKLPIYDNDEPSDVQ